MTREDRQCQGDDGDEGTMEGRHDEREAQGRAIPLFFEGAKFKGK